MSVEMAVYLVDWDDFQEKVRHEEAYEVLEQLRPEPLEDGNAKAPMGFLEAFDAFKRGWTSDERLYFKEVFDTLFWSWRGGADQVMELEEGEGGDLFGIDVALKPETVKELAGVARRLDLGRCRPLFEEHVTNVRGFNSFDHWKGYAEEWLGMLRRAAEGNKGLVLAVFG
jgi:hypothetical protein